MILALILTVLVVMRVRRAVITTDEEKRIEEEAARRAELMANLVRLQEKKNKRFHKKGVDKTQK